LGSRLRLAKDKRSSETKKQVSDDLCFLEDYCAPNFNTIGNQENMPAQLVFKFQKTTLSE